MSQTSANLEEFMKATVTTLLQAVDAGTDVYIYNMPLETVGPVACVYPNPGPISEPIRTLLYTVRVRGKDEAKGKTLIDAAYAGFQNTTFPAPTANNAHKIISEVSTTPTYEGTDSHGQATYSLSVELTTII